ncbi:MAG: efflux RND transporter permease subunit, partial [Chitinispirillaceae bacterium]|nr:efflux RND transporter permease subunit [Chitinispirillaceae bacterium]
LYKAAVEGGITRLRPVLMTASTTIFGMIPLALKLGSGAEMWMPLARAVIGGLLMTTFLTLIVVPVLYIIFEELGEKVKRLIIKS